MDKQIMVSIPVNALGILDENGKWIGDEKASSVWTKHFVEAWIVEENLNNSSTIRKGLERKIKNQLWPYTNCINPQVVRIKSVEVEIVDPRFTFIEWLEVIKELANGEL